MEGHALFLFSLVMGQLHPEKEKEKGRENERQIEGRGSVKNCTNKTNIHSNIHLR